MLYDNKYEYIRPLGSGGFGKVILAEEKYANRLVAIKQLKNTKSHLQEFIIREIQFISKFNHPNIAQYYTHFSKDGLLHIVMEYCAGGNLAARIADAKIPAATAFQWLLTLTQCLQKIHSEGVFHCDIKPENILFTADDTIKISDFGIANSGDRTIAYMCPDEIINGTKPSPSTDIYALGITLMEMLTTRNPFSGLNQEAIINRHRHSEYNVNGLPGWQQDIILRAINQIPELRFRNMSEFSEAISAKAVPVIFSAENLKAAGLVQKAEKSKNLKKWRKAGTILEFADRQFPGNVQVLAALGKYYLSMQKVQHAKTCLEQALRFNPRLNLQKELGWIHAENKQYSLAISLLSDHLHRHAGDYEAHNLLLRCYYETGRFELGMQLARMIFSHNKELPCFYNNYFICHLLHIGIGKTIQQIEKMDHPFIAGNMQLITTQPCAFDNDIGSLQSKLLFMDARFNRFRTGVFSVYENPDQKIKSSSFSAPLVTIGREGYSNDIVLRGEGISRRHCTIVNCKDEVWIYDHSRNGTWFNGERVLGKAPLTEQGKLKMGNVELTVTPDHTRLL